MSLSWRTAALNLTAAFPNRMTVAASWNSTIPPNRIPIQEVPEAVPPRAADRMKR